MHRGSSKGARRRRVPETLPLSAPLLAPVEVRVEIVRAGASVSETHRVAYGTTIRGLLRSMGLSSEGCAVLLGDRPLPADEPIVAPLTLTVVPTFSGG